MRCLVFLVLFFSLCLADEIEVQPNVEYNGKIGDGHYYRFYSESQVEELHSIYLTPGAGSTNDIQLIVQDMRGRVFSTVQAPLIYDGNLISLTGRKVVCKSHVTEYYDMFPAGQPNTPYTILVKSVNGRLDLNQTSSGDYLSNPFDITWFFYDHIDDGSTRPLEITVRSSQHVTSKLIGVQTECPTVFSQIEEMEATNRTFLTWSTKARMILSNSRKPLLTSGRWFFGIQSQNFTASKNFTIEVQLGMPTNSYLYPMLIPPLAILGVILFVLILSLLIMSLLTKRVGQHSMQVTNSWGYFLITITVGVVFLVPGFQVISEELTKMELTGDRDLCYFNEFCMKPSGSRVRLMAQNNVYSNVGYVVAGLGFIFYAWGVRFYSKKNKINVGIPRDGSIPYAMGVAIILEGISSGLYHFCPSRLMFQFDSAHMFVIIALGLAELWRRAVHPPSKPALFFWLSVLLTLNYIGAIAEVGGDGPFYEVFSPQNVTWLCFGILIIFFVFFLFPFFLKTSKQKYYAFWRQLSWETIPKQKFSFWVLLFLLNASVLLGFTLFFDGGLATTFLGMLTLSQLVSLITYEISNLKKFTKTPKLFLTVKFFLIVGFVVTWSLAIWYFVRASSNKALTPEASRALSSNCIIADFYDSHDMWHFLSALSLLLMCLIFFHLDLNANWKGVAIGERAGNVGDFLVQKVFDGDSSSTDGDEPTDDIMQILMSGDPMSYDELISRDDD